MAALAVLVVVMEVAADLRFGAEISPPHDAEIIVFWGNLFSLALFATFVSLGVRLRKQAEAHKRLMLLASFSIAGPALARFADWPISPGGPGARPLNGVIGLLVLFGSLLAYDLVVRPRPHPVSAIGVLAIMASLGAAVFLGLSGRGYATLREARLRTLPDRASAPDAANHQLQSSDAARLRSQSRQSTTPQDTRNNANDGMQGRLAIARRRPLPAYYFSVRPELVEGL